MSSQPQQPASNTNWNRLQRAVIGGVMAAFMLYLLLLVFTGRTWLAVSYAMVTLFAALIGLAIYFWSTMLLGGLLEAFRRRETPVSWSFEIDGDHTEVPEHDIDPGLQLMAAGVLVYRFGEVRPSVHFRQVPLANARALRPFVVARTGNARPYRFRFSLEDEGHRERFDTEFEFALESEPHIVMPSTLLVPPMANRLVGRRWRLRVTSGATVVATFGFMFVTGQKDATEMLHNGNGRSASGSSLLGQPLWLPDLMNEALKRDAMSSLQEAVLEDR